MSDGERKSRLHIHLGGLIILAIIALILFKVDIKSQIDSPQFQKNYSYIEEQVKIFWDKYILTPIRSRTGEFFINFTNRQLENLQDNFTENVLQTDGIDNELKRYEVE